VRLEDIEPGIEGIGAHQYLGNEILLRLKRASHLFHPRHESVENRLIGIEARIQSLLSPSLQASSSY